MGGILGIGTEITECLRIARLIERHGEMFINRVYTDGRGPLLPEPPAIDAAFCRALGGQGGGAQGPGDRHAAGVAWTDIEIRKAPSGRPAVAVRGAIKDVVERLGVAEVLVSIAHCRTHAVAYAIALGREKPDEE